MRILTVVVIVTGSSLLGGGAAALWKSQSNELNRDPMDSAPLTYTITAATPVALAELLEPGPKLKASEKARSLNGQRVHLVGFMARMEEPLLGGFYLVPRPLSLDESGAGTGDLPSESVLVLVPGSEGKVVTHVQGALEGTGILEVGNQSDAEGRVSNFRLKLDPDQRLANSH